MAWDADALVIGSGIAGGIAALCLADAGRQVVLVTRARTPDESNTWHAQGGIVYRATDEDAAALIEDIHRAGRHLGDPTAVRVLAEEGPAHVEALLVRRLDVPFARDGDDFARGLEAGHSRARILHVADTTGRAIEEALLRAVRAHPRIELRTGCTALELLCARDEAFDRPACAGVRVWDAHRGRVASVLAPATVLATGGFAALYARTTNPPTARGDGIAMAARLGARLAGLEYVQFHPTAFARPGAPSFLLSEAVRGAGARLVHADGEPFMARYDPAWRDLAPRDTVARAIFLEMHRRGVPHVYLDLSHLPADRIRRRFPTLYRRCLAWGVDMTREPVPVAPAAHYTCGGVRCDVHGRTDVPRLYVAGEVAASGVHGANRLASTSLLEGLVWGARAAAHILAHLPPWPTPPTIDGAEETAVGPSVEPEWAATLADTIRRIMWERVGIVRDGPGLREACRQLHRLARKIDGATAGRRPDDRATGLRHMVDTARRVAAAALANPHSRGCHWRADDPATIPRTAAGA